MKKIHIKAAAFAAKLCGFGVAALGFSSCDSDVCMYGTGPSTFDSEITVKGEVSTEENNPVENAEITVKYTTGHKIATGNTDSSGQYEATGKMVSTDKYGLSALLMKNRDLKQTQPMLNSNLLLTKKDN